MDRISSAVDNGNIRIVEARRVSVKARRDPVFDPRKSAVEHHAVRSIGRCSAVRRRRAILTTTEGRVTMTAAAPGTLPRAAKTTRQVAGGLADFRQVSILLLKLFLAPLLVVASTLAGRRWGQDVAGILVGLPIVAGPILVITYLQHGAGFASGAAGSSLFGLVSLAVFAVVFARTAGRFGWPATLATGWIAVLATDAALSTVQVTTPVAVVLTLAATTAAMILLPRVEPERLTEPRRPSAPKWDLLGRAVATGVLVVAVTTASGALGPRWTGLLAPFPIATSVVAAFVHAAHGHVVTTRTLRGVLTGLVSFAAFCLSVAVLVRPIGGDAFVVATAVTVVVQLLAVRTRRALSDRAQAKKALSGND
jgi:MFS family permease